LPVYYSLVSKAVKSKFAWLIFLLWIFLYQHPKIILFYQFFLYCHFGLNETKLCNIMLIHTDHVEYKKPTSSLVLVLNSFSDIKNVKNIRIDIFIVFLSQKYHILFIFVNGSQRSLRQTWQIQMNNHIKLLIFVHLELNYSFLFGLIIFNKLEEALIGPAMNLVSVWILTRPE